MSDHLFTGADPIGALQDAFLARLRSGFGWEGPARALKAIEPVEVPFDQKTAGTFRVAPPAVYLTPLMVRPTDYKGVLGMRWAAYCVAGRATSQTRAAGGVGPFGIGAYAIAANVALLVDDWRPEVPGANSCQLLGVENLTGLTLVDQKLAVWAATFSIEIGCALENPTAALAEFLVFHADIDVAPYSDPPDGALPAARDAAIKLEIPR